MKIEFPTNRFRKCRYFIIPGFGKSGNAGYRLYVDEKYQEFLPNGLRESNWSYENEYILSVSSSGKVSACRVDGGEELFTIVPGKTYSVFIYGSLLMPKNWRNNLLDELTWGLFDGRYFGAVRAREAYKVRNLSSSDSKFETKEFHVDNNPIHTVILREATGVIPTIVDLVYDTLPERIDAEHVKDALSVVDTYVEQELSAEKEKILRENERIRKEYEECLQ